MLKTFFQLRQLWMSVGPVDTIRSWVTLHKEGSLLMMEGTTLEGALDAIEYIVT